MDPPDIDGLIETIRKHQVLTTDRLVKYSRDYFDNPLEGIKKLIELNIIKSVSYTGIWYVQGL